MGQIECVTRYDLVRAEGGGWQLNCGGKVVAWRENKIELLNHLQATLDRIGDGDGKVRIHSESGGIEEERTYPQ
jgi:hypothetical protein